MTAEREDPMTTTPQEHRYRTAWRAWEAALHRPLTPQEHSLLVLVTADAGLWAWAQPRLDAAEERVDLHGEAGLNAPQRLLLSVARNLYGEERLVDLAAVTATLNEPQFALVLDALRTYRGDTEPAYAALADTGGDAPAAEPLRTRAPETAADDPGRSEGA